MLILEKKIQSIIDYVKNMSQTRMFEYKYFFKIVNIAFILKKEQRKKSIVLCFRKKG